MTVADLINQLRAMPQDAVVLGQVDDDYCTLRSVIHVGATEKCDDYFTPVTVPNAVVIS